MREIITRIAATGIRADAPNGAALTAYDRRHMLTYARLLDAESDGHPWTDAARDILLLDVDADPLAAEQCWRSHRDRARWIVGEGLAAVVGEARLRDAR